MVPSSERLWNISLLQMGRFFLQMRDVLPAGIKATPIQKKVWFSIIFPQNRVETATSKNLY